MSGEELRVRTKRFALRVLKMADVLPRKFSARILGAQVVKSATSIGANYREAARLPEARQPQLYHRQRGGGPPEHHVLRGPVQPKHLRGHAPQE